MKITRRRVVTIIVALALLGISPFLLAATPDSAGSRRVALSCGQTVTTSVTLTADVTSCSGYGLIAGANGITINLNGHTISGSGSTHDGLFDASFSSVVFENGTVKGFVRGVEVDGGSATIRSLRVTQSTDAGIYTFFPAVISANVVYGNGNNGIVVGCCASDKSTLTNNIVTGNTGNGIVVSFTAVGSIVSGNHVLSNTNNGIVLNTDGVNLSNNIANANGADGFSGGSSDQAPPLKATNNTANHNTQLGINLNAGDTDGGTNKASGNGSLHQCENIICS